MSKSLSIFKSAFLWVLLIVPMMFMFAACDQLDTKATFRKDANYSESDTTTFNAVATDAAVRTGDSYRLTVNIKMDATALIQALATLSTEEVNVTDAKADMTLNAIITQDAIAIKMTGTMMAGTEKEKINGSIYVTDGKMYVDGSMGGEAVSKVYVELAAGDDLSDALAEIGMDTMFSQIDPATIVAAARASGDITVSANGNHFKLEYNVESLPNTLFINFDKDGVFEAMQAEMSANVFGVAMETTVIIAGFDGKIDLPNFSGYTKVDSLDDIE
ncbi:MAG: hypothetical protein IJU58_03935 [Clostridia bacterium]|nr:hypothetical protein [Clostridia bacterium]